MLILVPEDEAKVMTEVKRRINSVLIDIVNEYGIDWKFLLDSSDIEEGSHKIENAMARICTKVKQDKQAIEDYKKMKASEKRMDKLLEKEKKGRVDK